ncbi:MAG: D-glycero-beta-D-manno-heptose 1-phosphate adenylyltransferase [Fimbriimonadaceae bacterium]|nr:D-glycero-beta-D-manno-heptose 1-phosphate adenylyltransferase [Fimbriimonadaceae bacterium]QYK56047.1 MAG: D-glycero-beta-D-manno-heptose 1-phosphate adenylyltransferase [Fimbriimonadaceae bacterium]
MPLATLEQVESLRAGRRLVFTNGVFDILHAGHVDYLEAARALGDLLVVAINSDDSVRRLGKGANRPINPLVDRARVVAALRAVDAVVSFDDDTPEQIIAQIQPDVHVKGGDYREEDLPEARIVRAYGGEVVILPFLPNRSTTAILERLSQSREAED